MRPLFRSIFIFLIPALSLSLSLLTGCGLLFGSNKVDNKSDNYRVYAVEKEPQNTLGSWRMIRKGDSLDKNFEAEVADLAYEHSPSGAIISLNSVCREYRQSSLDDLLKNLLLGLPKREHQVTREIIVDGQKALESTVDTTSPEHTTVRVRAIVMRKKGCTYDLMYIAQLKHFDRLLESFSKFVRGFHVKD